mmetsp:Transcript_39700/g.65585  ORF Transcript_39700/g.65585 Transcript_39700/m.65585 type:complete len:202 (+) Transcript_39700:606-1211(+)
MATNHRHGGGQHITALGICYKCPGTANIERSDAKELLWVVHALGLQNLCCNWHSGVDRVGDDADGRCRARLRNTCDESLHDARVDVEEIVTGHAGLAGNTGRDHNNITTIKCFLQIVAFVAHACGVGGDVGKIHGNSRCEWSNIIARKSCHAWVELQAQRERLANASRGAQHRCLEAARLLRRESSGGGPKCGGTGRGQHV